MLQVYPNLFSNSTQVEFSLAQYGEVDLAVYDVLGRKVIRKNKFGKANPLLV